METALQQTARRLAHSIMRQDTYRPGYRHECGHRYQCDHYRTESGELESIHLDPTPDVVHGPPCPVHGAPMHRMPGRHGWNCHGYDGEGCTVELMTESLVSPLMEKHEPQAAQLSPVREAAARLGQRQGPVPQLPGQWWWLSALPAATRAGVLRRLAPHPQERS